MWEPAQSSLPAFQAVALVDCILSYPLELPVEGISGQPANLLLIQGMQMPLACRLLRFCRQWWEDQLSSLL